ncbi:MAG: SDR family oxidoreductase [Acidobacteriota bacterium]
MSGTSADRFLVTGAASGIGRRLVGDLAERGHRVLATDLQIDALDGAARDDDWPDDRVRRLALDVRSSEAWEAALDDAEAAWGGLDVVMNVAGVLRPAWIAECTDDDVDRHLDVNVKGVIYGTRAAARRFLATGGGHIVNVASLASMAPVPGIGLYVGSKYAVRGFSLAADQELRPQGVAVTTVCPDAVKTPMLDLQVAYDEAAITFTAPRFLEASDVSELILGRVLSRRPVLVAIPRRRAFLARLADLFPGLANILTKQLTRRGRRVQKTFRH